MVAVTDTVEAEDVGLVVEAVSGVDLVVDVVLVEANEISLVQDLRKLQLEFLKTVKL